MTQREADPPISTVKAFIAVPTSAPQQPDSSGSPAAIPAGPLPTNTAVNRRRRPKRDLGAVFGACWLLVIVSAAILADVLPLPSPSEISEAYSLRPFQSGGHLLGTDELGRDELSRAIHGARVSLAVAIGATLIALVAGTAVGITAGYFKGPVDGVFDVGTNTILAFPPLILLIALVAVMEPSATTLTIGLGIVGAPTFVRIARANTIAFANREFVTAARSMGAGSGRIIAREILPNVLLPVVSFATVVAAGLVVAEGSLSFLGLGIPPPTPSWGGMIAAGRESLYEAPYLVLVPGVFFFLTVFSLNRLGDWARGRVGRESSL